MADPTQPPADGSSPILLVPCGTHINQKILAYIGLPNEFPGGTPPLEKMGLSLLCKYFKGLVSDPLSWKRNNELKFYLPENPTLAEVLEENFDDSQDVQMLVKDADHLFINNKKFPRLELAGCALDWFLNLCSISTVKLILLRHLKDIGNLCGVLQNHKDKFSRVESIHLHSPGVFATFRSLNSLSKFVCWFAMNVSPTKDLAIDIGCDKNSFVSVDRLLRLNTALSAVGISDLEQMRLSLSTNPEELRLCLAGKAIEHFVLDIECDTGELVELLNALKEHTLRTVRINIHNIHIQYQPLDYDLFFRHCRMDVLAHTTDISLFSAVASSTVPTSIVPVLSGLPELSTLAMRCICQTEQHKQQVASMMKNILLSFVDRDSPIRVTVYADMRKKYKTVAQMFHQDPSFQAGQWEGLAQLQKFQIYDTGDVEFMNGNASVRVVGVY